jgi:5-formyltetrahydrofolate cyclo-ligase
VTDAPAGDRLAPSKAVLRAEVLARRADRDPTKRAAAAQALARQALELPELLAASCVAAYASTAAEPGTRALLEALRARGLRVLLPLLRDDFDLDWAELTDPQDLREGRFGILEPAGPSLGVEAVLDTDAVVCPGVAADLAGHRLGRGGGSYDRVLARLGPRTLSCLLLYDDEVLADVPHHDHDQQVDAIVTPTRILRISRSLG